MSEVKVPEGWDKRRVYLREEDCVRMNRYEVDGIRKMIAALYTANSSGSDLQKRLQIIPHGAKRFRMVIGGLNAIANDIIGTMTRGQARQVQNTLNDNKLVIVPKLSTVSDNVVLDREIAADLISAAKARCRYCTKDGVSCRQCKLYKLLEAVSPKADYGSGMLCPYSMDEEDYDETED